VATSVKIEVRITHSGDLLCRYYTAVTETPMKQLLNDALIMARDNDFDVFNALNILENSPQLLRDLKFGEGDGNLHYYLYNWHVSGKLEPKDVGLILM
jgi:glycylpeptide N-tetradecanoyltransferase